MQPANYSLDVYRGDSARWRFKLWVDTERTQPVDLAQVIPKAEIRDKPMGAVVLATMACTITLPNTIDVVLTAAQSHALPVKGGAWDLQLTYASGDIQSPIAGAVSVVADVTDSVP